MSYADKTITCRDCGMDFVFTSGEQEFYAQKGFTNEPTRCASCRQQRKAGGGGRTGADEERPVVGALIPARGVGQGEPAGDVQTHA